MDEWGHATLFNEAEFLEEKAVEEAKEEKTCGCGAQLHCIGKEESKQVEFIPAHVKIIKTIRPKYACKACEGSGDEGKKSVKTARVTPCIYPKSIFTFDPLP